MFKKVLIALVVVALFYGFFIEPNRIMVHKYKVANSALKGIRIVFIGDLHARPGDHKKLRKIITEIGTLRPDVVLCAGGFLGGNRESSSMPIEKIAERLNILAAGSRIVTVLGEQDIKFNKQKVLNTLTKNSVIVLSNSNKRMFFKGRSLFIAGVEGTEPTKADVDKALKGTVGETILLSHSPNVIENTPVHKTALILAGHTHGGQIVIPPIGPIIMPKNTDRKYAQGYIEDDNKKMIVTRGLGVGAIPLRINCQPEIVVVDFE